MSAGNTTCFRRTLIFTDRGIIIELNKLEIGGVIMEEKITLCGDNCIECPRYNAHSDEELKAVAELWYKVGWRECLV